MEQQQWIQLLEQLDAPGHLEYPPDFNLEESCARLERLASAISIEFGITAHIENNVQDAGFHGEIVLPREYWNFEGDAIAIRACNFGSLAVAFCWGCCLPQQILERLSRLMEDAGYLVIPEDILHLPYTGRVPLNADSPTWWVRFFDWF